MSDAPEALVEAVRAKCNDTFKMWKCTYPRCDCISIPLEIQDAHAASLIVGKTEG